MFHIFLIIFFSFLHARPFNFLCLECLSFTIFALKVKRWDTDYTVFPFLSYNKKYFQHGTSHILNDVWKWRDDQLLLWNPNIQKEMLARHIGFLLIPVTCEVNSLHFTIKLSHQQYKIPVADQNHIQNPSRE